MQIKLNETVVILEDEPMMQQRFSRLLVEVGYQDFYIQTFTHLKPAMDYITRHQVGLALVDLHLPDGSGLDFLQFLHQKQEKSVSLVISGWSTQSILLKAIQAGASGYLLKERDDTEIQLAIRQVLQGGAPIDPFLAQEILKQLVVTKNRQVADDFLTTRERQILELVANGLSNREIAEQLFVSRYTVESHIKHLYRKLAVSKRTQAVQAARSLGIL